MAIRNRGTQPIYQQKGVFIMTIDANNTDRSYLFGRLYGCLLYAEEKIGSASLRCVSMGLNEFRSHPSGMFRKCYDSVISGKCLQDRKIWFIECARQSITDVMDLFKTEDFNNEPITDREQFYLGYKLQRASLYHKNT